MGRGVGLTPNPNRMVRNELRPRWISLVLAFLAQVADEKRQTTQPLTSLADPAFAWSLIRAFGFVPGLRLPGLSRRRLHRRPHPRQRGTLVHTRASAALSSTPAPARHSRPHPRQRGTLVHTSGTARSSACTWKSTAPTLMLADRGARFGEEVEQKLSSRRCHADLQAPPHSGGDRRLLVTGRSNCVPRGAVRSARTPLVAGRQQLFQFRRSTANVGHFQDAVDILLRRRRAAPLRHRCREAPALQCRR